MDFLSDVVTWLSDPAHWSGSDGIPNRIAEHLLLSLVTTVVAVLIALPFGIWAVVVLNKPEVKAAFH